MTTMKACHKGYGLVHVYTGDGKGKTTAAWGLALRALGRGKSVAVVQFLKSLPSGEVLAVKCFGDQVRVLGETRPYDPHLDQSKSEELREDSRQNFNTARDVTVSRRYDLVILDEINVVLRYGFVTPEEMLDLLARRPKTVDVVLTGRYAPGWLIDVADLVTEMATVKHPAEAGAKARIGIEF